MVSSLPIRLGFCASRLEFTGMDLGACCARNWRNTNIHKESLDFVCVPVLDFLLRQLAVIPWTLSAHSNI